MKQTSTRWLLPLLTLGAVTVAVLTYYVINAPAKEIEDFGEKRRIDKKTEPEPVTTYKPSYEDGKLNLSPVKSKPPIDENPIVFALNSYFQSTGITNKNAKVLEVRIESKVAIVKVSDSFNQTYGTEDEQTLLKGIQKTLSQFPEVRAVRFYIGDQRLDTLGNVDLTEDLPVP